MVVLAQQLGVHLAHPVDGLGPLDAEVWGWVPRGLGAERSNRARNEQLEFIWRGDIYIGLQFTLLGTYTAC